MNKKLIILFFSTVLLLLNVNAQQSLDSLFLKGHQKQWSQEMSNAYSNWEQSYFLKPSQGSVRQNAIMNGNKITAEIWNFGSISAPNNRITDIIWEGLGYGYEFAPFVGSQVPVPEGSHVDVKRKIVNGDTIWYAEVISDGLKSNGGEIIGNIRWGWQPLIISDDGVNEFLSLESDHIPTSDDRDRDGDGKPDSWPRGWYNSNLREYVWPGALGQGATNADKESFFVFDDRDNKEFKYFPYPSDSSRQGLGLEVEARYYQWSNVEAEDAIFLIFKIKNKGYYSLNPVIFGMWGDPHIGGPDDWQDDWANFDTQMEMTFAWDNDGTGDNPDIIPGYLGYKFLESPGVSTDGIDNDEDGMIDESWADGIDNDNDWNIDNDDVGIDGIENTGDYGEKDGMPTAGDPFDITKPGEPNFEFTDIDESDMIGLTSFSQPLFAGLRINDDRKMWEEHIQPGIFDTTEVQGDYVFLYGSGKFELKSIHNISSNEVSDAIKRFSIALICAQDKNDLILNAETVQRIYNSGYQFAKPPAKPTLSVVPGDRKVTLFWDNLAESSRDPISKEKDFEGYIIYRSTDPGFLDQQTITDMYGNRFLFEPLKTSSGANAQFDLENDIFGPSNIQYAGRGVSFYLGDDTGVRHSFVDSNNVINGQTYFYTVVSYDHGSDSLKIPPSVCSKIISFDPTTNEYTFDINTTSVIPRRRSSGYTPGEIKNYDQNFGVSRERGHSTGTFKLEVLDDRKIEDDNKFYITFYASDTADTYYLVEDANFIEETFVSFYDNFVSLKNRHVNDTTIIVSELDESIFYEAGVDFEFNGNSGSIKVYDPNSVPGARMSDMTEYKIKYTYFPIYQSTRIDGELSNPVFDGIRLSVKEDSFAVNAELSGWSTSSQTGLHFSVNREPNYAEDPWDYEVEFFDQIVDTTITNVRIPFIVKDVINNENMEIATTVFNKDWEPRDTFFILRGGLTPANIVWEFKSSYPDTNNTTAPGAGDIYYLATHKAFATGDMFSFETKAAFIDNNNAKNSLNKICVVPNPYVATNAIEPSNKVSTTERGYRRLYFDHLPNQCTIRIYTQAGELVKVLEHNSSLDDGKHFWDLLSKDNMEVAYGLYFFHVDAPGIGEKIGKFVIIK